MNKGFISIYLCILLSVIMSLSVSIYASAERYHGYQSDLEEFRLMNMAEVLTIHKVKQDFFLEKTVNDAFSFENIMISLSYENNKCHIHMESENFIKDRILTWDYIDDAVREYR